MVRQMFEQISTHLIFVAAAEMFIDEERINDKHHGFANTADTTYPSRAGHSHPVDGGIKL